MLFVPEAKPRDTNHTVGIIAIWYFDKEHILIAQSVAEACYLEIKHIFILQNVQKVSNTHSWLCKALVTNWYRVRHTRTHWGESKSMQLTLKDTHGGETLHMYKICYRF